MSVQNIKGNVSQLPVVDSTLTRSGYSADAKATGDAIAENKQRIEREAARLDSELDVERGKIDQIANNQIPVEYLEAAVDAYVEENTAGLATQESLETVESELKSDLSKVVKKSLKDYLYKENAYIGIDGTVTDYTGIDTYKIPVSENDFIYAVNTEGGKISDSLSMVYWMVYEDSNGNFSGAYNADDKTRCGIANFSTMIAFIPSNIINVYINIDSEHIDNMLYRHNNLYLSNSVEDVLTPFVKHNILDLCLANSLYIDKNTYKFMVLEDGYTVYWFTVNSGDVLHIDALNYDGLSYIGEFISKADFSQTVIAKSTTLFTCPCDGYVFLMNKNETQPFAWLETKNNSIGTTKELDGKRWCSLGDSITYLEKWQGYVANEMGLIHSNCGIGSTCVSGSGSNAFWKDVRLNAVKATNADIVTILGGANDLVQNPVIGTETELSKALAEKDTSTFIGAYSYIIENLLTWKPTLEIMILGTTWAHNDGADYSDTVTYTDFSEACRKVAEYYGLPFVDLHGQCGFNAFTMGNSPYNIYSSDNIHPNDLGGRKIASIVIAKMKECYSNN